MAFLGKAIVLPSYCSKCPKNGGREYFSSTIYKYLIIKCLHAKVEECLKI
jgi:hypothetical protein